MRIAFLILAQGDLLQLRRLVLRLTAEGDHCFVHLDARQPLAEAEEALAGLAGVELSAQRQPVWWGGWGGVEAAMTLVRLALAHDSEPFDRLCLLHSDAYPCRSLADLRRRLKTSTEFVGLRRLDPTDPLRQRYEHYHLMDAQVLNPRAGLSPAQHQAGQQLVQQFLADTGCQPPAFEHPLFYSLPWWMLTRDAARYLVDTFDDEPYWRQRFRYTRNPDEALFATILGNSPMAARCVGPLHYMDWSGQPGPKVLTLEDAVRIQASGRFFVRSCQSEASATLLDWLDAQAGVLPATTTSVTTSATAITASDAATIPAVATAQAAQTQAAQTPEATAAAGSTPA